MYSQLAWYPIQNARYGIVIPHPGNLLLQASANRSSSSDQHGAKDPVNTELYMNISAGLRL